MIVGACRHAYTYVYLYTYIYIYIYMYIHIYIYQYIYTYNTCIHINVYILIPSYTSMCSFFMGYILMFTLRSHVIHAHPSHRCIMIFATCRRNMKRSMAFAEPRSWRPQKDDGSIRIPRSRGRMDWFARFKGAHYNRTTPFSWNIS